MPGTTACPIPAAVLNARATLIGATLVYKCADGFQMTSGPVSITCVGSGWNGNPPVCTVINTKPIINNSYLGNSHVPWWVPILFATFFGLLFLICLLLFCVSYCCGYRLSCYRCCRCPSLRSRRRLGSYDTETADGVYVIPRGTNSRKQLGVVKSPDSVTVRVKNEYFTRLPNGDLIPHTKPTTYRPPNHAVIEQHYLRLSNGELVQIDKKDVKNYKHTTSHPPSLNNTTRNIQQSTPVKNKKLHDVSVSDELVPVDSPYETEYSDLVDRVMHSNRTQPARELKTWMPHSKHVRNINTSTK